MGYDEPLGYVVLGVVLWFCVFNSGIHATIAGVIAAFAIPASAKLSPLAFTEVCRLNVDEIEAHEVPGAHTLEDDDQQKGRAQDPGRRHPQHRAAAATRVRAASLERSGHPAAVRARQREHHGSSDREGLGVHAVAAGRVPRACGGQAARDLAGRISGGADGADGPAGRRHLASHHRGGPSRRHRLHHVAVRRQPRLPSGRSGERGQDRHPRCIGCGRGSRLLVAALRDAPCSQRRPHPRSRGPTPRCRNAGSSRARRSRS